jgi:ABC-type transport system involved in multi-copper enzyme maturation permease subunit
MIFGLIVSLFYLAVIPMLSSSGGGGAVVGDPEMKTAAGRDFLNFALGGLNFIGMFMAIFITLGSIHTEIERGTITSIITKPLHRWQVIVGKWAGHVLIMVSYVLIMGFALWLSVAIESGSFIWHFFPAIALVSLNVATMVTLTMTFSVFLPVIANAIFVFIIFVVTSNLRVINAISQTSDNIVITVVANILRLALPVSEVSDLTGTLLRSKSAEAAMATETAVFAPRSWSFAYEMLYIVGLVLLAAWIFKKRDLK